MTYRDKNLENFILRYHITEITDEPDRVYYESIYSYTPFTSTRVYDDFIHRRAEKMVSIKISETGLEELMKLASDKELEKKMLKVPQVRDAYEKYKVIESLYKRNF